MLQTVIAVVKENKKAEDRCHDLRTCANVAQELKQRDLARKCLTDAAVAAKENEGAEDRCRDLRMCAEAAKEPALSTWQTFRYPMSW